MALHRLEFTTEFLMDMITMLTVQSRPRKLSYISFEGTNDEQNPGMKLIIAYKELYIPDIESDCDPEWVQRRIEMPIKEVLDASI